MPARPLSEEQQSQIREVVRGLALEHGFDGWRIADVVKRTGVSSRTLYKYFPSKEYLLLDSLLEVSQDVLGKAREVAVDADRPAGERVQRSLAVMTHSLIGFPVLARAMMRCLVCGQEAVAPLLDAFNKTARDMVLMALQGEPGRRHEDDLRIQAELLKQVWFAAMVAWASGIREASYIDESVERAVAFLGVGAP